jgi:hypothetical protein
VVFIYTFGRQNHPQASLLSSLTRHTLRYFRLREHVVQEDRDYVESFVHVLDPRIDEFVRARLAEGELWPEAVFQLNPGYEQGPMLLATRIAFATVSAGRFWPCGRLGIGLLGLRVVTSFAVNRGIRNLFSRIWHYLATRKFDRRRRSFMGSDHHLRRSAVLDSMSVDHRHEQSPKRALR